MRSAGVAAGHIGARRTRADEIVCLETPFDFYAVGQFYREFHQVEDAEVIACLELSKPKGASPQ